VSHKKTSPFLFLWYLCQISSDFAIFSQKHTPGSLKQYFETVWQFETVWFDLKLCDINQPHFCHLRRSRQEQVSRHCHQWPNRHKTPQSVDHTSDIITRVTLSLYHMSVMPCLPVNQLMSGQSCVEIPASNHFAGGLVSETCINKLLFWLNAHHKLKQWLMA